MKGIGILPGYQLSHIDHLVPLCQILDIPILVTEREVKESIEVYYPPMEIIYAEAQDYCLDPWLEPYDTFIYADPYRMAHGHFLFDDYFAHKRARSIYTMHGNSDKKSKAFWIEQLADEDLVLLYGPQSFEFLKTKGVHKALIHCGNYRLEYYKKNLEFFNAACPFTKEKTTILYAPTWSSPNKKTEWRFDYSSFFETHVSIFKNKQSAFQLIVKLHPLYELLMPEEVNQVKEAFPDIFFLDHFPLIYPLLSQIDLYLGDFSSIGYDFLHFQRPMFFLNFEEPTQLQACGRAISKQELFRLYAILEKNKTNSSYQGIQKKMYEYAFGEKKDLASLKKEIESYVS